MYLLPNFRFCKNEANTLYFKPMRCHCQYKQFLFAMKNCIEISVKKIVSLSFLPFVCSLKNESTNKNIILLSKLSFKTVPIVIQAISYYCLPIAKSHQFWRCSSNYKNLLHFVPHHIKSIYVLKKFNFEIVKKFRILYYDWVTS